MQERRHLIRAGLVDLLGSSPRIDVIGGVATGSELLRRAITDQPDVIVLELEAPWRTDELIHHLVDCAPDVRIVALHQGRRNDHEPAATQAGVNAMAAYRSGTAAIVAAVLGEPVLAYDADDRRVPKGQATLTPRELQVLRQLADGCTAAECAAALRVSRKTVDNHKQRIFMKLGVQNQAHAVSLAHRMGLLGHAARASAMF